MTSINRGGGPGINTTLAGSKGISYSPFELEGMIYDGAKCWKASYVTGCIKTLSMNLLTKGR